jgi:uncharacterized repeat protein (TIGR04138 family)
MHTANFDEAIEQLVKKDRRYQRDAYQFVREALDHTEKAVNKGGKSQSRPAVTGEEVLESNIRHVSGQQLLEGIRLYALEQFGPMAPIVFEEWGVRRCEDFGEIVFNMVETNLLAKTKKDSREDFKGGYDFDEAFRQPFRPAGKPVLPENEAKSTQV